MRWTVPFAAVCAGFGWGLGWWMWDVLPDPMPSHWGLDGQPDGWLPRSWGVAVAPLVSLTPWLIEGVMALDVQGRQVGAGRRAMDALEVALALFGVGVQVLILQAAGGASQALAGGWLLAMMGGLWMVLGASLPKLTPNRYAGVRTPWTLGSDTVWAQTHRLTGRAMLAGGAVTVAASAILEGPALFATAFTALMVSALVGVPWSWWRARQQA